MKISNNGIKLVQNFEGYKAKAYLCPAGVWTIGYGTTRYPDGTKVKRGDKCTKKEATIWLKNDLKRAEKNVNGFCSKYKFNQNQFDALVDFAYNVGSINQLTANGTRTKEQIANKILLYNKAGGKVLSGLTKRRKMERALFVK